MMLEQLYTFYHCNTGVRRYNTFYEILAVMLKSLLNARSEQCFAQESQDQNPDTCVTSDVKKMVKESIGRYNLILNQTIN